MTMDAAMAPGNLLCYEMNGQPLPVEHGFPVRLIAPGWYGVANVKWLKRIELIDHRFAGRFMARDYVTFRERTDAAGNTTWTFQTVGPYRLKSAPAKVTRKVQGNNEQVPDHRDRLGWIHRPSRSLHRRRPVAPGTGGRPGLSWWPICRNWRGTSGPTTGAKPPADTTP